MLRHVRLTRSGGPVDRIRGAEARPRDSPLSATATLRDEVVDLLRRLIRVDTTNPPGNETGAAELLREYLGANGVACELYARAPERANLVARVPGGDGPTLLLLSHTDVVLATEPNWEVPPFSGELRDGYVWGRGALDMKGQVAANAVAIASLAREGFRPRGELVFAATADEEVDTGFGLSWLCDAHPDAVRCDFAINEGGGDHVQIGGRKTFLCATAEKRSSPVLLRVHGQSGHAAYPSSGDNALVKAAALVTKLGAFRPEPRLEPEVVGFFEAVDGAVPSARDALARAREIDPLAGLLIEPVLGTTFTPSVISASQKRNVIPGVCEVEIDCRLLPGQTEADALALVREILGEGDYELASLESKGGTRSPLATPLWDVVESFVAEADPEARVVPMATAGFTDSHWLREAFGTVAYGFFPSPFELAAATVHSANERVPVDDLELGVQFLRYAARAMLG